MTLALDTTALLSRFLEGPTRAAVLDAMSTDPDWCASALALSEALMLVDRLGDGYEALFGKRRPALKLCAAGVIVLVGAGFSDLPIHPLPPALPIAMWLLAVASVITLGQRVVSVRRSPGADEPLPSSAPTKEP